MRAYLIVRAQVPEADREAFDRWYRDEHLPQALAAFEAERAWRGWSDVDAGVHLACYEFASLARARGAVGSESIKALIAEFDRTWQGRVTRTRDVVERIQSLGENGG